jgi:hypothetical protein
MAVAKDHVVGIAEMGQQFLQSLVRGDCREDGKREGSACTRI